MCKKMLQGLFGGGQDAPPPPAQKEANYTSGKEGEVLGAAAGGSDGASASTKLSGGLPDPKRKKAGVPGLGL